MYSCLIGHTGLVGGNLAKQFLYDENYNSKNIREIKGKKFDLVYCAGVSSLKWLANKEPENDLNGIVSLINALREIKADKFVLISTIDVYRDPIDVDEDSEIITDGLHPYGLHRRMLETFILERFLNHHIIRLPHCYGPGLKKNVLYDFLHNNQVELINPESNFQFYNLDGIYNDIQVIIDNGIKSANFATEPITVNEMVAFAFNLNFLNKTNSPLSYYMMKSKYAHLFGSKKPFILWKDQVLEQIKNFVDRYKKEK